MRVNENRSHQIFRYLNYLSVDTKYDKSRIPREKKTCGGFLHPPCILNEKFKFFFLLINTEFKIITYYQLCSHLTVHSAMDESRQDNLANANLAKRMKANLKADLGVKADELKA